MKKIKEMTINNKRYNIYVNEVHENKYIKIPKELDIIEEHHEDYISIINQNGKTYIQDIICKNNSDEIIKKCLQYINMYL